MASRSTGGAGLPRFLPPDPRIEEPYLLTPRTALRVAILGVVALIAFGVLFLRLWSLQILSGSSYLDTALNNQLRTVRIEAPRGPILDRKGRVLVTNAASLAVELWPADLPTGSGRDTELRRLSELLDIPPGRIRRQIREHRSDPLSPITLRVAVKGERINYLYEHQAEFPGVRIRRTFIRRYNSEALAAHLLGYVGEISPEQLKELRKKGYVAGDRIGQAGVEATYDEYLRGVAGLAELRVDSLGRPKSALTLTQNPEPGRAIRLTIDIGLQRAAERALRYGIDLAHENGEWAADGGAIVALDPMSGEVLAMASSPTYRPSVFAGRADPEKLAPLLVPAAAEEANYPAYNRAIAGLYPAGSVFKPATALAALQERLVSAYQPLACTPSYFVRGTTGAGQTFKNWDPNVNREMTMPEALAASCDTYFYRLGHWFFGLPEERGHPLQQWASRFGFGALTGVDVRPEESGLLPTPEWREQRYTKETDPCCWQEDRLWKPGDSIQLAIGQKDLLVTPLQMARFYAMLANGGSLVTPHMVADVELRGGDRQRPVVLRRFEPPAAQPSGVDFSYLQVVQAGLYEATHAEYGTSSAVFRDFPVPIAGKTGTAEKYVELPTYKGLRDQSWWCGWGPVDSPKIVVCALIENGGHGGSAAAPAALKVFEHYFGVTAPAIGTVYSD